MIIENLPLEAAKAIADELGIHLVEQKPKHDGEIKVLVRPAVGSRHLRAITTTGRIKPSLCMHGHYAFMARVLAAYPSAVMRTWVNTWDYIIFQNSARLWTEQQIRERAAYDTCDCTPDVVEDAMKSPDELMLAVA